MAKKKAKAKSKGNTAVLPAVTEADVMSQMITVFCILGLTGIHRQNTGGAHYQNRDGSTRYVAFGEAGAADWAGVLPDGRHVEIECKRPGERPTPEQFRRLHRVNDNGGVGFWVDDSAVALFILQDVIKGAAVVLDDEGVPRIRGGKD